MSESIVVGAGTQDDVVDAILEGGPAHLPPELRVQRVARSRTKIKVSFYGGYEHFERDASGQPRTGGPVVFRWTDRTRIAE